MLAIIISIVLGILVGRFSGFEFAFSSSLIEIGLYVLLFFVGMDIGKSDDLFRIFRRIGKDAVIIPLLVIGGSIVGGIAIGLIFGYTWNEGAALGSGMGWYSLSGVILEPYSKELSAIAFMSNIMREVISMATVPLVVKIFGSLSGIAEPAAGAMDTVLPIISKATDQKTTILAFFTGTILSFSIPILVQFFIGL